jgi:hypothetical protein
LHENDDIAQNGAWTILALKQQTFNSYKDRAKATSASFQQETNFQLVHCKQKEI